MNTYIVVITTDDNGEMASVDEIQGYHMTIQDGHLMIFQTPDDHPPLSSPELIHAYAPGSWLECHKKEE